MAGPYIAESDITDSTILDFSTGSQTVLSDKITLSTEAVEDLAERRGVPAASIKTDPVHYMVKRWAVAWVCTEIAFDFTYKNNQDVLTADKYREKYEVWKKRLSDFEKAISTQMLDGTVYERRDRATVGSGTLFRS